MAEAVKTVKVTIDNITVDVPVGTTILQAARMIARERYAGRGFELNSDIPARSLRTDFKPDRLAMNFLHDELDHERLTARGLHKVIRLGWTLADLAGRNQPTLKDVTDAYELREGGIS
jgi:magnesium chelatase family protein